MTTGVCPGGNAKLTCVPVLVPQLGEEEKETGTGRDRAQTIYKAAVHTKLKWKW